MVLWLGESWEIEDGNLTGGTSWPDVGESLGANSVAPHLETE